MNAGAYNKLITIQRRSHEQDAEGFPLQEWEDYYSNYAYVNNLSGTERWNAAQVQSDTTVRFVMRWHKALDAVKAKEFRIVYDGAPYIITFVDNVMHKNETVKIDALEVES